MAVRTPVEILSQVTYQLYPLRQKWVFHALYQHAFPHLYSSEVCFRNRLVLTNEDEAEYRSFESLIQVTKEFSKSSVMLCTFHGIWMASKKDLITLLDECACGKLLGMCVQFEFLFLLYDFTYTNSYTDLFCMNLYILIHTKTIVLSMYPNKLCPTH
jgi:hypothetical protein